MHRTTTQDGVDDLAAARDGAHADAGTDTLTLDDVNEMLPGQVSHDQRPEGMHAGCDCGSEAEGDDPWRKGFTRRRVVAGSAAMVAALGAQTVTTKWAFAAPAPGKPVDTDTVVVVSLRGGWDHLSIVAPLFEQSYQSLRPQIGIPQSVALPLGRGFGLHPSLPALHKLYRQGTFAPVVAVGTPGRTLDHFGDQATVEHGSEPGRTTDGWMNRVLQARRQQGVFSAVQFGGQLPVSLQGQAPALALDGVQSFGLAGYDDVRSRAASALTRLYSDVKHPMTRQVTDTLRAIGTVQNLNAKPYTAPARAQYPQNSGLANSLRDIARLIRSKIGLTMATIDVGGWDMHTNLGTVDNGDMKNHLVELDASIAAFVADLDAQFKNVTMVFVSEFGRNIPQNGSMGSEHGHGQCMWVLGGGINGGKVYGAWPGLAEKDRFVNNSLPGRTDYRDVLGEVLRKRGGVGSLSKIFPDHKPKALGLAKQR